MTSTQSTRSEPEGSKQQEKSAELVVVTAAGVRPASGGAVLPRSGLDLPGSLSFENWLRIGEALSVVRTSSAWCLGDWLVYGESAYAGRYRDAIKRTSLDYQTLRNYAWVAKRFPMSRRRATLSFGHHAEVTSLPDPEQDFWLRKCETYGWSTSRLRREVRSSLRWRAAPRSIHLANTGEEPGQVPAHDDHATMDQSGAGQSGADSAGAAEYRCRQLKLQLVVFPKHFDLCQAAAEKAGLSVEQWAIRTLYTAASQDVS